MLLIVSLYYVAVKEQNSAKAVCSFLVSASLGDFWNDAYK